MVDAAVVEKEVSPPAWRDVTFVVVMSIFTLGIYWLYWWYVTCQELRRYRRRGVHGAVGVVLGNLTPVGFFLLPAYVGSMYREAGRTSRVTWRTGFWGLLLPLAGQIVWQVKVQRALNAFALHVLSQRVDLEPQVRAELGRVGVQGDRHAVSVALSRRDAADWLSLDDASPADFGSWREVRHWDGPAEEGLATLRSLPDDAGTDALWTAFSNTVVGGRLGSQLERLGVTAEGSVSLGFDSSVTAYLQQEHGYVLLWERSDRESARPARSWSGSMQAFLSKATPLADDAGPDALWQALSTPATE